LADEALFAGPPVRDAPLAGEEYSAMVTDGGIEEPGIDFATDFNQGFCTDGRPDNYIGVCESPLTLTLGC